MITERIQAIEYFRAPDNYFWQWADRGSVIEWKGGDTICYTDDLASLLNALTNSPVPPFGAVLLVLAACYSNWSSAGYEGVLHGLKINLPKDDTDSGDDEMDYHINQAGKCANLIASLPKELRTGMNRAHLLHEVFKDCKPAMAEDDIRSAVDEWRSGRIDNFIKHPGKKITQSQFKEDLACLVAVFHKYGHPGKLEKQLRAGIFQMPAPLPLPIPEPENKPGDFWEQLATEPRTAGIAGLAKHIIAALHIPMHTDGSSDQLYGGVSDITNRGSYDKLLLTELAHDDHTLLARLANNEALYLQREQPPYNPKKKRVILADATLKMWGIPKVFAVSAAIACAMNTKHGERVEAFVLKGNESAEANFSTSEGVWSSLEIIDHSLNCYAALDTLCSLLAAYGKTDCIFITRNEVLHDPSFQKILSSYPDAISFLLGIDRDGNLHFYSLVKGRSKLLSTAKFDLDDILAPKVSRIEKKAIMQATHLPEFFSLPQAPLLFPAAGLRISSGNSFYHSKTGVLTVTDNFRLLHWKHKNKGAVELLPKIESGYYSFGYEESQKLYLLITATASLTTILYTIDTENGIESRHEIDINGASQGVYSDGQFFVRIRMEAKANEEVAVIDCKKGMLDGVKPYHLCRHIFVKEENKLQVNPSAINRFVNNGYNILQRFTSVAVGEHSGCLYLNNKALDKPVAQSNHLTFRITIGKQKKEATREEEMYTLPNNEHSKLTSFVWQDGSKAIIDARGFLHLVSSNKSLPEVSLVLIQGKTIAGWASDGTIAGSDYFIAGTAEDRMMPDHFYTKYIEPILQRISQL